jgi:hypothetical protein
MTLPGFNAETSLFKTSVHYRLMGPSIQTAGVMPQQFPLPHVCGPCEYVNRITGECAQTCSGLRCWSGPGGFHCGIETWHVRCPPYMCWPQ